MSTLAERRLRHSLFTALAIAAFVALDWIYRASLHNAQTLDGWLLIVAVLALMLFNVRKKIPVLPLLSAAAWLEIHAYLGVATVVIFVMHAGMLPPEGELETVLWFVFLVVAISGMFGLWLSRTLPGRMRRHGELILLDRFAVFRVRLAREVEELAQRSVAETASTVIADLYADRLAAYFAGPRNQLSHLFDNKQPLHQLRQEILKQLRYLNPEGRAILAKIESIVTVKENLDYQHALQMALRLWLFIHVPLTYAMLLLIATHVVLVYGLGRF